MGGGLCGGRYLCDARVGGAWRGGAMAESVGGVGVGNGVTSDRVGLGSHSTLVLTSPRGIRRPVNLSRESGARLTRSLPLRGSDIECRIAARLIDRSQTGP